MSSPADPTATDVLLESFERVPPAVRGVLDGLAHEQLLERPVIDGGKGNSIGWLVWHLARVEDAQIAGVAGRAQVWDDGDWATRLGVGYADGATGYGMSDHDVDAFTVTSGQALADYQQAVHARTVEVLRAMAPTDLSRVVDEAWDPPVTALVRIVSIVNDITQHVGQAAYARGLLVD